MPQPDYAKLLKELRDERSLTQAEAAEKLGITQAYVSRIETTGYAPWENDDWYWMRVEVGSDEYIQALADHFEVADRDDGKMRILRKPKPSDSTPIDSENTNNKTGAASQQ